jgi:cytidylate kinase
LESSTIGAREEGTVARASSAAVHADTAAHEVNGRGEGLITVEPIPTFEGRLASTRFCSSPLRRSDKPDRLRPCGRVEAVSAAGNVATIGRALSGSAEKPTEEKMAVIAMTREMGTRGSEVAGALADRLGLKIIHHEIVEHDIAERSGMPESEVHRFLEGEASLLERWKLDRKRMSRYTAQEILELAARGNVLIRGWGATYLLKGVPHVLCVRICAPLPFRETVLMERLGLKDASTARREILRSDAAHNRTMQSLFGIDWQDPSLYAIVLNTARVPVSDCANNIVQLVESERFQETADSRGVLMDQLILARVRFTLDRRFGATSMRYGFEANVLGGKVILTGATTDEQLIVEAVRLLQGVEGVTGVTSKIEHIAFAPHEH